MSEIVIPVLVAGVFALLGAFIGAALTRRTEYEKCLRQARTEGFATFLRELHDTRLLATATYCDESGTEQQKSTRVTEAFTRFQKHVALARLFVSEAGRQELSSMVNDLWVNCTVQGGPANRVNQIKELMRRIQAVLEHELNYVPRSSRRPFKSELPKARDQ